MLLIDQDFLPQATALISMATSRIDLSTFKAEITSKPRGRRLRLFFDTLFRKREAGVQINFLLNWNDVRHAAPLCNLATILELKRHKINVQILPNNRCCHAKVIIVDKDRAIIGSHNLSIASCHNNFEASYLVLEKVSVTRLSAVFDHTLSNSKTP